MLSYIYIYNNNNSNNNSNNNNNNNNDDNNNSNNHNNNMICITNRNYVLLHISFHGVLRPVPKATYNRLPGEEFLGYLGSSRNRKPGRKDGFRQIGNEDP